jgi:uncharacterized membrane protein
MKRALLVILGLAALAFAWAYREVQFCDRGY